MKRPSREDREAARTFYDRIAPVYDHIADASEQEAREVGLDLLDLRPGETALEIGFGTGHALVALARAVGDGGRVIGVDLSEGMAGVASRRLREAGVDRRVTLLVEAIPPLPLDDGSLDAVFAGFTLELFPDGLIPRVFEEIRRVLRPGGRLGLVAMDQGPPGAPGLAQRAYAWMHRHFPHIVDCRPIDVSGVVARAGFVERAARDVEIWGLPVRCLLAEPDPG